MRKRTKTVALKRITAKAVTGVPKFFGVLNDPLGNQIENQLMQKEEAEQRRVDRFWGQDKDLFDRELENISMGIEDEASLRNEEQYKIIALHRRWDEEFHRHQWIENKALAVSRERERKEHLVLVTALQSSEDVVRCVWNNRAPEDAGGDPVGLEDSKSRVFATHHHPGRGATAGESAFDAAGGSSSTFFAPSSLEAIHMSVHLDGLQKSRAIVDKASFEFKQTLRRINAQSGEEGDAVEPFKRNPLIAALTKSKKKRGGQQHQTTRASTSQLQSQDISALQMEGAGSSTIVPLLGVPKFDDAPPHVLAIDGHPQHRWDQETMLQAAFHSLDVGSKGFLLPENLAAVSHSSEAHALLRHTVFWAFIKKRQWEFFASMMVSVDRNCSQPAASSRASSRGSSRQRGRGKQPQQGLEPLAARFNEEQPAAQQHQQHQQVGSDGRLTLGMWLTAAESVAREPRVPLSLLRTQEEHLLLETPAGLQQPGSSQASGAAGSGPISSSASKSPLCMNSLPERESRVSRILDEGDCVWALHRRGGLWLPAVVIQVHRPRMQRKKPGRQQQQPSRGEGGAGRHENMPPGEESRPPVAGFCYDLWYPLSERDLHRARALTTSRHLLALPSQSSSHAAASSGSFSLTATQQSMGGGPNQLDADSLGAVTPAGPPPLATKPLAEERAVCAYAFDLADSAGAGIVPLKLLVRCMQSFEFSRIVSTSLALSTIFAAATTENQAKGSSGGGGGGAQVGRARVLGSMDIPPLLPVFIDTFSAQPEEEEEEEEGQQHQQQRGEDGDRLAEDSNSQYSDGFESFRDDESRASSVPQQQHRSQKQQQTKHKQKQQHKRSAPAATDWISKLDFLEFCQAAIDIKKYSVSSAWQ